MPDQTFKVKKKSYLQESQPRIEEGKDEEENASISPGLTRNERANAIAFGEEDDEETKEEYMETGQGKLEDFKLSNKRRSNTTKFISKESDKRMFGKKQNT
eukprot:CAMPEP_0168628530 /NCGR_PEP_ID=MMETSP0449_2-20121227/11900_1 /TAXON_ID=1082188 /ORGANISM="Strombidium rassoulzadegani, Strain ras09" /LENGTH=100 /DNA_ID=CAMNT_0008670969 /DNA_START=118 /DNA_END=420 /DNA_ORIENTATION=+